MPNMAGMVPSTGMVRTRKFGTICIICNELSAAERCSSEEPAQNVGSRSHAECGRHGAQHRDGAHPEVWHNLHHREEVQGELSVNEASWHGREVGGLSCQGSLVKDYF